MIQGFSCDVPGEREKGSPHGLANNYTPKTGHFAALPELQNYRVFSPPSKVVLKVLNRLKPQAEGIIVEKQSGFRFESMEEHL